MFGSKKALAFANSHTLISRATRITGDIRFVGELQLEGKLSGNIIAEESNEGIRAVIAESAVVDGNINVPYAVINGRVNGDIYVTSHIELAAKAVVNGNIYYNSIEMVKGSMVNGNLIYQATEKEKETLLIPKNIPEAETAG